MSTRSFIGIIDGEDNVRGIYCHCDGHIDRTGAMLQNHYNSQEAAEALIAFGDASYIEETLEESCFYHRDRNEEFCQYQPDPVPFKVLSVVDFDYTYLFDTATKRWWLCGEYGKKLIGDLAVPLSQAIAAYSAA